jgi:hypothetical protein
MMQQTIQESPTLDHLIEESWTLMPAELKASVPALYSQENTKDPLIRAKYFTPWSNWTWYVLEYDGNDLCFGYVEGHEAELGYFSVSELAAIRGPGGLRIERDLYLEPTRLSDVQKRSRQDGSAS